MAGANHTVKGESVSDLMRVYLAGKISGAGWRDALVPNWSRLISVCEEDELESGEPFELKDWPILGGAFLGIADYVGPYAISVTTNHATRLPGMHGSNLDVSSDGTSHYGGNEELSVARGDIVGRCFRAIDKTDVVVVVITGDSPGTLCELGYAHARGKPIVAFVRDGTTLDWFPSELCRRVYCGSLRDDDKFQARLAMSIKESLFYILAEKLNQAAYYKTRWWLNRRHRALELASMKCQLCAATKDLSVHHNTYENVYREKDADLCVLCDPCHKTADVRRRAQEKAIAKLDPFDPAAHEVPRLIAHVVGRS